jgi:hypothetical protein
MIFLASSLKEAFVKAMAYQCSTFSLNAFICAFTYSIIAVMRSSISAFYLPKVVGTNTTKDVMQTRL